MTSWWLGNLAEYSLQVGLLVTVGGLLPVVFRLREPRLRLVYWQVLLACCLLLPFAQPWHEPGPATFSTRFDFVASATQPRWDMVFHGVSGSGPFLEPGWSLVCFGWASA